MDEPAAVGRHCETDFSFLQGNPRELCYKATSFWIDYDIIGSEMLVSIGIEPDLKLTERLTFIQEDLGKIIEARGGRAHWTRPEIIHLPVKFLGQMTSDETTGLCRLLDSVTGSLSGFTASFAGLEAYPAPSCPRIISLALCQGRTQLLALRDSIDAVFYAHHYSGDPRPYKPTLTLGRVSTPKVRIDLTNAMNAIKDLNFGLSNVSEIVLYGASLTPAGTDYRVLSRHILGTGQRQPFMGDPHL